MQKPRKGTQKKNKPITSAKLKKKIWELCKQVVRKRDGDVCVICNARGLTGSNWQTGHFIPSSICGAYLRYDIRNLHSNCMRCNIHCGGNGAMYYQSLVHRYGQAFVDSIFADKNKSTKADITFYENKVQELQDMCAWSRAKLLDHTRVLGRRESAC